MWGRMRSVIAIDLTGARRWQCSTRAVYIGVSRLRGFASLHAESSFTGYETGDGRRTFYRSEHVAATLTFTCRAPFALFTIRK